jgi:SpoVK/Ycf46/Vps4 family AAA+-type ATPase
LVLVVAATNRIDMIDSALIRPGRFDKLIYVPPLDRSGRLELLQICAKTSPFSPNVDFEEIAETTEGWTGADIVNLCREVRF